MDESFPGGASGKEHACQCRRYKRRGLIPGLGRSPGEGHGNPLQYSCLENPMDRRGWRAMVHTVTKTSDLAHTHTSWMIIDTKILNKILGNQIITLTILKGSYTLVKWDLSQGGKNNLISAHQSM